MEEGEYFAIETFGSTGRGKVIEEVSVCLRRQVGLLTYPKGDCSHYAKIYDGPTNPPLKWVAVAIVLQYSV